MKKAYRGARRLSVVAVGVATTSLALTACASSGGKAAGGTGNTSTSKLSPQQAVAAAVAALGKQSSIQIAIDVPMSQSQLEKVKDSSGTTPSPADAKALASGSVFFTEASGKGESLDSTEARTDPHNSLAVGLSFGSDTPVEVRYVDQNLYAHIDASGLLHDVGQPSSDATQFNSTVSELNNYVPGLSAVGQGKWVEVTQSGLQSLSGLLKQAQNPASGGAAANPQQMQADILKLRTQVLAAIQSNSAAASLGSSNGRTGYSVTVNLSGLVNTLVPEIQSTLSDIPGFSSEASNGLNRAKGSIPAGKSAVIDVYVSSNKLTEADLDLNQFSNEFGTALPLRLAFTSPGGPSAPSGATTLDVSKLPALLGNLLGGLKQNSAGASGTT